MTPQKALTHLRNWYKKDKTGDVDSGACVVAFEALEKQIPKKPNGIYDENESQKNKKTFHYEQVLTGQCPKCSQEVQEGMNFCMDCGQAIDWSVGNE